MFLLGIYVAALEKYQLHPIESCGLIESIFKEIGGEEGKKYNLKDYSELVENDLDLEVAISLFTDQSILFLNPFSNWTKAPPTWWSAYNKLKHDRLNNYNESTYENAIHAMAGLHQVISRNTDFIATLLSAGWFNRDSEDFAELFAAKMAGARSPVGVIPVESKFFVSPLHNNFVDYENEVHKVSDNCDFSKRVQDMLMVFEWL
jgi:hypothetical protein